MKIFPARVGGCGQQAEHGRRVGGEHGAGPEPGPDGLLREQEEGGGVARCPGQVLRQERPAPVQPAQRHRAVHQQQEKVSIPPLASLGGG